jgi:hypothetical protein
MAYSKQYNPGMKFVDLHKVDCLSCGNVFQQVAYNQAYCLKCNKAEMGRLVNEANKNLSRTYQEYLDNDNPTG